jgi:peptide methionine sulfoxide reductase msrA/msrB
VEVEAMERSNGQEKVIYLAGGCFWGLEALVKSIPGVKSAVSGYANGISKMKANYEDVCKGDTGFRETVEVKYDPTQVSLDALLFSFFQVIDPTLKNRQGNDIGTQYQTGVYYGDDEMKEVVEHIVELEKKRTTSFQVEVGPLSSFYPAEEYHQNYLDKHPGGYCHIPRGDMERFSKMLVDPANYPCPGEDAIRERLTEKQYQVTQENSTEYPFQNECWDFCGKGIYVDVVTGEPLFSSLDKFESSCGWPAFKAPIDEPVIVERKDRSYGMWRTEVRSRAGNSHLGHVFEGDSESPNGLRYCINSASLRFVPYEKMQAEGYGDLLFLFHEKHGI